MKICWFGTIANIVTILFVQVIKEPSFLKMKVDRVGDLRGQYNHNHSVEGFWKALWYLKMHIKLRSFAWQCANNILATNSNLNLQGISSQKLYVVVPLVWNLLVLRCFGLGFGLRLRCLLKCTFNVRFILLERNN